MSEQPTAPGYGAPPPQHPSTLPPPPHPTASPPNRFDALSRLGSTRPFAIGIVAGLVVVAIGAGIAVLSALAAGFGPGEVGVYNPLGILFPLAVIAGLVWLFLLLVPRMPRGSNGAIDVLRQRYARGEITEEQYVHMVEVLKREL